MHTILPAALEIPKWIFHVIALNHNEIHYILGVGFRIREKTSKSYNFIFALYRSSQPGVPGPPVFRGQYERLRKILFYKL